ncbi:MAG: hypothetical protein NT062_20510 [Proteobacteria bacterium]|nr:hypothetical protein [Pseudomonadota bacterium]
MRWRLVLAVTAVGLAARLATAHVAPSVDDNNRYLKLTPQGDRLRLAYTVFFGEVPGAGMRPAIDANHDRTISDAEAAAFGSKIAGEVASSIDLVIDQRPVKVTWETVAVGMGA